MSVTQQISSKGGIRTQKFMSPEIINEEYYDEKVDVYSFGVIILFVMNEGDISSIKIGDIVLGKKPNLPETLSESVTA